MKPEDLDDARIIHCLAGRPFDWDDNQCPWEILREGFVRGIIKLSFSNPGAVKRGTGTDEVYKEFNKWLLEATCTTSVDRYGDKWRFVQRSI